MVSRTDKINLEKRGQKSKRTYETKKEGTIEIIVSYIFEKCMSLNLKNESEHLEAN